MRSAAELRLDVTDDGFSAASLAVAEFEAGDVPVGLVGEEAGVPPAIT